MCFAGNSANANSIRNVTIVVNPISTADGNGSVVPTTTIAVGEEGSGTGTPNGTESPGTSQMSPPPSYHDIPGTVPAPINSLRVGLGGALCFGPQNPVAIIDFY